MITYLNMPHKGQVHVPFCPPTFGVQGITGFIKALRRKLYVFSYFNSIFGGET
jgi:hypothetical protein